MRTIKYIVMTYVSIVCLCIPAMEKEPEQRVHIKAGKQSTSDNCIQAWHYFLQKHNWHDLIKDREPHISGCGKVYELPNYLHRKHESFAIVDMRSLTYAEPHYHPIGTEIYLVLQGTGLVVIGNQQQSVQKGDTVVIPPCKAHFTIPDANFVIAVFNLPAFDQRNYIKLVASNSTVEFDALVFKKLCQLDD